MYTLCSVGSCCQCWFYPVAANKIFLLSFLSIVNEWQFTYLGRKTPGSLSVGHPGGFSQQCLKQVYVKAGQSKPDSVAILPVGKTVWPSGRSRGNQWVVAPAGATGRHWPGLGGGGQCAVGQLRQPYLPGHSPCSNAAPTMLRQTLRHTRVEEKDAKLLDWSFFFVQSLQKT